MIFSEQSVDFECSSWGNSDRWWVYRMRPDFYVLCPSMELSGYVWIVIHTVETVFRYLLLTLTVSGAFVTPFYMYKTEKNSCLWLLLSFCCLLTDVGKFIFCVIWNLQTPSLLKSISNLLVHWLLKFPCSTNYLYSVLVSVLVCEVGEWPFSFLHSSALGAARCFLHTVFSLQVLTGSWNCWKLTDRNEVKHLILIV